MTFFPRSIASSSRLFPTSSVSFLGVRLLPMLPPEPPSPPTPPEPPDPPDPPPQIRFSSSETPSQLLPFTFSFSFVSGKSESQSQTQSHFHSLFLVIPYNLKETEALLHLPFSMAAPDVTSPPSEPPNLQLSTRLASISCTLQVASQAVEFRAACSVLITSSSLPLPCSQVMHLLVSPFCLDCFHISIVGKSLAFVCPLTAICSPLTAICSLFPDFVSGIEHMKIVLLLLWQFGLTSLMFMPLVNLVDFSFMAYVFLPKFPLGLSDVVARSLLSKDSNSIPCFWKSVIDFDMIMKGRLNLTNLSLPCIEVFFSKVLTLHLAKGFVPIVSIGIYGFVDVALEVQSLFRADPSHLGTRRQLLFPKFPLVWSGLDDQASPVLKGSSSRLMAFSALVAEFVTLWVALDAVTLEAFGIVLFRSPLVFIVVLYFQSISILPYCSVLSCFSCIVILYFTFVMVVIPPHLSEVET